DLVEEWNDLTNLPYVHGMWVGREESERELFLPQVASLSRDGVQHLADIAGQLARKYSLSPQEATEYLSSFTYTLGKEEEESLTEFIRYAYYHGILPDAPDLNFFDLASPSAQTLN
ncbi:MAG TPA: MqnA/MqnD/SBP family protein, partial [bacterium]|nr:MqnA/MqnD/SBP family protein [bacterium]